MAQPKDYDSTLARIAGNIAAGVAPRTVGADGLVPIELTAQISVDLAEAIVRKCRARAVAPPEEPSV